MPVERSGAVIGRDDERAALDRLVADERLVCVVGPGGAGKSCLVATWLRGAERWVDPVVLEVTTVVDADDLPVALARAAGVVEDPDQALLDQLVVRLGRDGTLVVLDDAEVHAAAVGAFARELLDRCPALHVVVSARTATGADGEAVLRIDGLRSPFAEQLFAEVAAGIPGVGLDPGDEPTVTELCARLDGLPLAIELAARRMAVLDPAYLLERLEGGLSPLVDGDRAPRHRAMTDVLTLTIELLPEPEQVLLRRLSVFTGSFPASAADAVADVDDVARALAHLADHCLLARDAQRYRLPETVRVHAAALLDSLGEGEEARGRAVTWAVDRAREASDRLHELEADHDVLLGVLAAASEAGAAADVASLVVALSPLWEARGHLTTGRHWLKVAVDATADAPPAARAPVQWAAGRLILAGGDADAALLALEAALSAFVAADDVGGRAGVLADLALVARHRGDHDEAERLLRRAIAAARDAKDGPILVRSLVRLADLVLLAREVTVAGALCDEARVVAAEVGDVALEAEALAVTGDVHVAAQEHERARQAYTASVERSRRAGDGRLEGRALNALGRIAMADDDLPQGRLLHEQAIEALLTAGDTRGAASSLADLAFVVWLQQDDHDASQLYRRSLELARRLGDRRLMAAALLGAANTGFALGSPLDEVRAQCEEAMTVLGELQDTKNLAWAAYVGGEIATEQRDWEAAVRLADHALELFAGGADHSTLRSLPLITLGGVAHLRGDPDRARAHLEDALDAARSVASVVPLVRVAASAAAIGADEDPEAALRLVGFAEHARARGLQQRRLRLLVDEANERAAALLGDAADDVRRDGAAMDRNRAADLAEALLRRRPD